MLQSILTAVIGSIVTTIAGAAIGAAVAKVKSADKKEKAERDGIQCLLRAEIILQHEKYAERGYCPIYAKEALKREYAAYHDLGGNDIATQLYNETINLPTAPLDKAE